MKTNLITGATGTVGREVVRAALAKGLKVRVGVRDPARGGPPGATAVRLDWADPASFGPALNGVDQVFLLTPFVEDAETPARAFLAAAGRAEIKLIVKLSASGVSEDAPFPAARHHARIEQAIAASGIPFVILRPTFYMENVLTFQRDTLLTQGAFFGASNDQPVAYISARDLGEVAASVLADPAPHAGRTYELTGGEVVRDTEVAALITKLSGRPARYIDLTLEDYRAAQVRQGAPGWVIDAMTALEGVKRNGWAAQVSPTLRELLGRAPERYSEVLARRAAELTPA